MSNRAHSVLLAAGFDAESATSALCALAGAGIQLADGSANELLVRWIDVRQVPVPPDADTIIRTITRTVGSHSTSSTHWLGGLRGPVID